MDLPMLNLSSLKLLALNFAGPRPSAGLVLRPDAVELVRLQGRKVASRVRVPISGSGVEAAAQAIREAVLQGAPTAKRLAVSLLSPDVLIRYFTLPPIPRPEWESAVAFEARKYLPFKMEELVWDYGVMPSSSTQRLGVADGSTPERLDVVFTGLPRVAFSHLHAALSAAGIQPTVIEPLSLSLARLAAPATPSGAQAFVCLVEVEPQRAHLVIAKQGIPYLTREVHLAPSNGAGSQSAESRPNGPAQQLLSELNVSMDFFTREYPGARIVKVLLFGEVSLIGSWAQELAGGLPCPVELGSGVLSARAEADTPLSFAGAVGLLQGGRDRTQPTLDFLRHLQVSQAPSVSGPRVSVQTQIGSLVASCKRPHAIATGLAAFGAALAICVVLGTHAVSEAQRSLDRAMREQHPIGLGLDGMKLEALKPIQSKAQQQVMLLKQLLDERSRIAVKLDALARALPNGVWITSLTYDNRMDASGKSQPQLAVNGACFLGGSGQELSAIQAFEERIKRNATLFSGFTVAQVGQINAQTDSMRQATYRTFQLNCRSDRRL